MYYVRNIILYTTNKKYNTAITILYHKGSLNLLSSVRLDQSNGF